jgi:hypothetical protein
VGTLATLPAGTDSVSDTGCVIGVPAFCDCAFMALFCALLALPPQPAINSTANIKHSFSNAPRRLFFLSEELKPYSMSAVLAHCYGHGF